MVSPECSAILPEGILTAAGIFFLLLPKFKSPRLMGMLTITILLVVLDLKFLWLLQTKSVSPIFFGMLYPDRMAAFFQVAILFSMVLIGFLVTQYTNDEVRARKEVHALLLFSTVGLLLLTAAHHLALIYLAFELISILSYLLCAIEKRNLLSVEAGLKYFLFGTLATGAMLYGISLIYGLTGTMDLTVLSSAFPRVVMNTPVLAAVALILLLVGFAFKVALVPFHMWAPDVYEGAPTPIVAFLSVAPKLAGFAVLARVLIQGLTPNVFFWPILLGWLAVASMTIGNLVALAQTNVKRLLAYSSIAHAGTILIGIAVATPLGMAATLYYLLAYLFMNLGVFLGVLYVGNVTGREDLGAFSGLSQRSPMLAFALTIALLSLAGIPPMAGFVAKFWIFGAALAAGKPWLAIAAAANSVIALFYYAKIIKTMYLDPAPKGVGVTRSPIFLTAALGFCAVALIVGGLLPGGWLLFASNSLPAPLSPIDLPWKLL